jgi:hypothetical protein
MLRLEKPVRDPENTTLKAPASKNLCNVRVNVSHGAPKKSSVRLFAVAPEPTVRIKEPENIESCEFHSD